MYALHRGGAVAATASAAAKNAYSSRLPLSQVAMTRRALCLARLHSSTGGGASEAMRRVRDEAAGGGARRRAAGVRVAPVWSRSARGMGSWTPAPGSPQERVGAVVVDAALSMRESLEAKQLIWAQKIPKGFDNFFPKGGGSGASPSKEGKGKAFPDIGGAKGDADSSAGKEGSEASTKASGQKEEKGGGAGGGGGGDRKTPGGQEMLVAAAMMALLFSLLTDSSG
ncbi:unnamed protein product, partial [Ectocarpus sp. 12 AP-2014]